MTSVESTAIPESEASAGAEMQLAQQDYARRRRIGGFIYGLGVVSAVGGLVEASYNAPAPVLIALAGTGLASLVVGGVVHGPDYGPILPNTSQETS